MKHRRISITAVLLVLALLVCGATASFAQEAMKQKGNGPFGKKAFMASGLVTDVDLEALTVTIMVNKANRALREFVDTEVAFTVREDVKIKLACTDEFNLTLADVTADDEVKVIGRIVDGVYEVRQILIY